jgi:2,3-bisphosphoglycerate-independent phosphoglycerate mutase
MKYLVLLADGAADYPIEELGGRTPLEAAHTPYLDSLAPESRMGMLETVPADMPPGSEVANLAVLGYDVHAVYQGRGVLEAASMGVDLADRDLAMRCNLISLLSDGTIKNHSAGHISSAEAAQLIDALNEHFRDEDFSFFPGVSYRHLFVLPKGSDKIECTPPHDVPGFPFQDYLVRAQTPDGQHTALLLNKIILESQQVLENHPVNKERVRRGKDPANSVWFWSQGYRPKMESYQQLFGKSGSVISAVDLIFGIGVYAGLDVIHVEGATGLYDTNYEGKAEAALQQLKSRDFVFLHVEASDEAGHEGDAQLKVKTIEYFDGRLLKTILKSIDSVGDEVAIAILPDHPTPCALKTHVHDSVPFMIRTPGIAGDGISRYTEQFAQSGSFGWRKGTEFIRIMFGMID